MLFRKNRKLKKHLFPWSLDPKNIFRKRSFFFSLWHSSGDEYHNKVLFFGENVLLERSPKRSSPEKNVPDGRPK